MRIGMNPQRGETNETQKPLITMAMITHIPYLAGYFAQMHTIAEVSLITAKYGSGVRAGNPSVRWAVFDNGSCIEWRYKLLAFHQSGLIDDLYLSRRNIGKCAMLRKILDFVRSPYIGYTDSDVLFYPGWLQAEMKVMKTFPNVALVGGSPILSLHRHFKKQWKVLDEDESIDKVRLTSVDFPSEWIDDHCLGVGLARDKYLEAHRADPLLLVEKDGVKAWAHGHHMQFIGATEILRPLLPSCDKLLMGGMRTWNNAIDAAGFLQLTTYDRFVRHMGNALDDKIVEELKTLGVVVNESPAPKEE